MGAPIVLLLVSTFNFIWFYPIHMKLQLFFLFIIAGLALAIANKVRNKAKEDLKTVPFIVKIALIIGGAMVIARHYF